jgi:monofunctional chorismate mutase
MRLEALRKEIEAVDKEMLELFIKRMDISYQIGSYKKEHHLPVFDEKREKALLEKQRELLDNEVLWPLYKEFLKEVMRLSKEFQKTC